jgi:pimeloyl-ACP methyl ester carboxylesterase
MDGTDTAPSTGYAPVGGLQLYYERYRADRDGADRDGADRDGSPPLVVIHGSLMTIDLMAAYIEPLAATREVIAVELQAHGRTRDIDRPLRYESLADDIAALLAHLGIPSADLFGYSTGAGVALQVAIRHPGVARRLVVASGTYRTDGMHPAFLSGLGTMTADDLGGTPWEAAYLDVADDPDGWPALVARVGELDREPQQWPSEAISGITAPTMVVIGDSDLVRPEHAVRMFGLLGGGVAGDLTGLPDARLAVLPGTTHVGVLERADWLVPMIVEFLG